MHVQVHACMSRCMHAYVTTFLHAVGPCVREGAADARRRHGQGGQLAARPGRKGGGGSLAGLVSSRLDSSRLDSTRLDSLLVGPAGGCIHTLTSTQLESPSRGLGLTGMATTGIGAFKQWGVRPQGGHRARGQGPARSGGAGIQPAVRPAWAAPQDPGTRNQEPGTMTAPATLRRRLAGRAVCRGKTAGGVCIHTRSLGG